MSVPLRFRTGQIANSVPIYKGSAGSAPRVIVATLGPINFLAGDQVHVHARVQASNETISKNADGTLAQGPYGTLAKGYPTSFDTFVIRYTNPTIGASELAPDGRKAIDYGDSRIIRPLGGNTMPSPWEHHRTVERFDSEVIAADYTGYYHLVCYAGNLTYPQAGDALILDAGDAALTAFIYREAA